jgi:tripartite-type tricarboxylate transporter receptor subunit TctC
MNLFFKLFAVVAIFIGSSLAKAESPPALLIGNAGYIHTSRLENPHKDVKALGQVLRKRGFEVVEVLDANNTQMKLALTEFTRKLAKNKRGFIYYAGHGVQLNGKNYFLPIDIRSTNAEMIEVDALSLQTLLDEVGKTTPEAVAIVLDACRDNPFASSQTQSTPRGLGEAGQTIPKGVIVAYGASAGQGAIDSLGAQDDNPNGLFTRHMLRFLQDETLSIQQVLRRVRDAVMIDAKTVKHRQIPSTYDASIKSSPLFKFRNSTAVDLATSLPKSIRLIVPAAAGGPTDFVARRLTESLRDAGVQMQIENIIDIQGDRVAAMDYPFTSEKVTLLMSNYPAALRREMLNDKRFQTIGMIAETPMMLATNMQTGIRDMKTLIDLTRTRKQSWKIGISGPGSQSEACLSVLKYTLGEGKVEGILYKGMAPALMDMLGGQVDLICDIQTTFEPQVQAGKLRYVANFQEDASPDEKIPTSQSQGYAVVAPNWTAIFAPSQLPAPMKNALTSAFRKVVIDLEARLRDSTVRLVSEDKSQPIEVDMSLRLGAEIAR